MGHHESGYADRQGVMENAQLSVICPATAALQRCCGQAGEDSSIHGGAF